MNKAFGWLRIFFVIVFLIMSGGIAHAQIAPLEAGQCGLLGLACPGGGANPVISFIYAIINLLLILVGIAAMIAIIYGGIRYIASRGNEEEARAAKNVILYAVLGLVVVGLAAAIVGLVISTIQGA